MAAPSTAKRIYAVLGTDDGEVFRASKELSVRLTPPDAGEFGLETIDGTADNVDHAVSKIHQTIEALQTLPFFGGGKLVWLKHANFLGDTPMGRSESVVAALEKLSDFLKTGLSDDTFFLLSTTEIDKRRSFYKNLSKTAELQIFDRIDTSRGNWEQDAAAIAVEQAQKYGIRFTAQALDLFVLLVGANRSQMINEIEKIALMLGSEQRPVTEEDVRLLVPQTHAAVIWELGNAILMRNAKLGLKLLHRLLQSGESPIGILLATIVPSIRNLLLVKDLMERYRLKPPAKPFFFGKTLESLPADARRYLPQKKDGGINAYPLGLAAGHAHRYTLEELYKAYSEALQTNFELVSSQISPAFLLEKLLLQIL